MAGRGPREPRGEARSLAGALTFLGLASVALVKLAVGAASPGLAPEVADTPPAPLDLAARSAAPHAYTLEADLDPAAHTIAGKGTIDFVNTSRRPVGELWVHLYLNAFESADTVFQRGPRGGFRGGGRSSETGSIRVERFAIPAWGDEDLWPRDATTPGEPKDRTDIRVPLPRALSPGETVRVAIAWTSKLPPVTLRTGYAGTFHMVGQWFPKIAKLEPDGTFAHFPFERLSEFYADFAEWDVRVRTPSTFVVGATGREVETMPDGDHVIRRFTQRKAHDFAFAAGDRLIERRRTHRDVELRALGPPGFEAALEVELEVAARGIDMLGARYGTYPHPTLTIVHPPSSAPEAGGMEYPALITTGGPWWGPVVGARFAELVTMHELAHQWFQGIVASNEREHPFLDEGLTSFAELEAMEQVAPGSAASAAFGLPIGTLGFYRTRSVDAARLGTVARAARDFPLASDYGDLVYGRTATLLATLDRVWPGEIRRTLGVYARRHRFAHPTPSDLLAALREEMGDVAADALRLGLMERGTVDFAIRRVAPRSLGDGRHVVDVDVGRAGAIVLPVEVDVIDEAGDVYRTTWDGQGDGIVLSVETGAPAARVVIDPELRIVCDGDLFDQAWSADGTPTAGRALGVTSFLARVLLAGVAP